MWTDIPEALVLELRVSSFIFCRLLQQAQDYSSIHPMQTSNQGPWQEELRANHNGKAKTVPRGTPARGWDGYLQQIGYAIASAGLIMISVRPQAGHDNNIVPARQLRIWCGSRHDSG
jgi:hypothetical protein